MLLLATLLLLQAASARPDEGAGSPPHSPAELASAFRDAFTDDSSEKAIALFFWRGVSPQQRARVVGLIDRDRSLHLNDVALLPPGAGPTSFGSNEQRLEPNLEIVGHLLAEFLDSQGRSRYSLHMIGVSAGVYYIALAVPPEA